MLYITALTLLFRCPQNLCVLPKKVRGVGLESRPSPIMSHRWVGLVHGAFCLFCLPSSNWNALVTAAFTPILATRTRLVRVRRHIGVMKATKIISCSDILHPVAHSAYMATGPRLFQDLILGRRLRKKSNTERWGQCTTFKDRTARSRHYCSLLNVRPPAAQARPSSRRGRTLAALEQTLFCAWQLVTATTWTFMISTLIPIPNQQAEPRG